MLFSGYAGWGRLCACLVGVCLPTVCRADFRSDTIQRGKSATALVDVDSKEFGTAFCVDPSGFFVTNAHVVQRAAKGGRVSLVLLPGEVAQKVVAAKVLRSDADADLALLQIEGTAPALPAVPPAPPTAVPARTTGGAAAKPATPAIPASPSTPTPANSAAGALTALELGDSGALVETAQVTAFGYPFGRLLAGVTGPAGAGDYPSVSVSTGHITSLRKVAGELQRIQLDASLNPGNSGGPVLDEKGTVVGVVVSGVLGSGVNFAIPASKVSAFLNAPQLVFEPAPVPFAKRHDVQDFLVRVVTFGKAKAAPSIELSLHTDKGDRKFVGAVTTGAGAAGNGVTYRVSAAPLPAAAMPDKVQLTATFASGTVVGLVRADAPLKAGTKAVRLADLRHFEPSAGAPAGAAAPATFADGTTFGGTPLGLESVDVDLGPVVAKLDLTKAKSLDLAPPAAEDTHVTYRFAATRDGKVLAELTGELPIEAPASAGAPVASAPPSLFGATGTTGATGTVGPGALRAPDSAQDELEVKLPGTVDDVTVGGGGRYLILTLKKLNQLAVFDVNAAKVVGYVSVPPTEIHVAASADKLIVVLADQKVIQRYALATLKRELATTLPVDGIVQAAAMGSASNGPLLLRWAVGTDALAQARVDFFDVNSLRKLDVGQQVNISFYGSYRDNVHIRAAASGDVFGLWATSHSPTGLATIVYGGGRATSYYEHDSANFVVPGPDGKSIFAGSKGVLTPELRKIGANGPVNYATVSIPSGVPGYYLTLPNNAYTPPSLRGAKPQSGSVCLVGSDRPLVSLPDLPELRTTGQEMNNMWTATDFTFDKRVHFLPTANVLITIPMTNDAVVVRKFNVLAELDKSGIDYLFVSSNPLLTARRGELYRYPVEVKSKRGGVVFKLESGPEGMTVSPAGLLTWRAPAGNGEASVILSVKDNSGQEVFHTFTISYGDVPSGGAAGGAAGAVSPRRTTMPSHH